MGPLWACFMGYGVLQTLTGVVIPLVKIHGLAAAVSSYHFNEPSALTLMDQDAEHVSDLSSSLIMLNIALVVLACSAVKEFLAMTFEKIADQKKMGKMMVMMIDIFFRVVLLFYMGFGERYGGVSAVLRAALLLALHFFIWRIQLVDDWRESPFFNLLLGYAISAPSGLTVFDGLGALVKYMQDLNNIDKALPPSYQAHMLVFAKLLAFVVFLLSLPVTTLPLHYTVIFLMLFGFGVWDVGNTLAVADGSPADRWHIFTGQDIFENESVRTALNTGSKMRSWWSNKLSNNLSQESQRSLFMFGYKDKTGLMFPSIVVVGLALITKLIVSTPVVLLFTPLVSVVVAYPFVQHSLLLCGLLLLLVGYT
mmetsp:Transcript_14253/g.20266  ORF Transcript_14253/g.20266 Transcript_14253/m.20266 type:complete len:366 (+) Transcript_14253:110-1207(+)